jgi:hypothetical protein
MKERLGAEKVRLYEDVFLLVLKRGQLLHSNFYKTRNLLPHIE